MNPKDGEVMLQQDAVFRESTQLLSKSNKHESKRQFFDRVKISNAHISASVICNTEEGRCALLVRTIGGWIAKGKMQQ